MSHKLLNQSERPAIRVASTGGLTGRTHTPRATTPTESPVPESACALPQGRAEGCPTSLGNQAAQPEPVASAGQTLEPPMQLCTCSRPLPDPESLRCVLCGKDSVAALEAATKEKTP